MVSPQTLAALATTALLAIALPEELDQDIRPDRHVPKQVWESKEISCPLDPDKRWGTQLPYPPGPGDDQILTEPKVLSKMALPSEKLSGSDSRETIVLEAVVNPHGRVERIGLLHGEETEFTLALVESLKSLEFKPPTVDGEKVCFSYIQVVRPHPRHW